MSFISILKKIGSTVLGIEHVAAPIAEIAFPSLAGVIGEVDTLTQRLQTAIVTVEANNPVGNGQLKSDAVIADFNASLALAQSIAHAAGQQVTYDTAQLQTTINAFVTAYNEAAKLKASIKISPTKAAT